MGWLRDIDRWFLSEVLFHAAVYRTRSAHFFGRDEVDDLVQEAYARVLDTHHFRAIESPRGFVLTSVRNLALERLCRANVVLAEIIKRSDAVKGFEVLPRRWVVERSLAWLNRNRRLVKNFEQTIASATAWLFIASIQIVIRCVARL